MATTSSLAGDLARQGGSSTFSEAAPTGPVVVGGGLGAFGPSPSGADKGAVPGAIVIAGPRGDIDLTLAATRNPNAVRLTAGDLTSFCPALSCIDSPNDRPDTPMASFFDHQRTGALFSSTTADDGHSEEQTVAITTTIGTGRHEPYAARIAYRAGDNVVVGNAVYRAVTAGTTGVNSAPPGTRPTAAQGGGYRVADGSVTWQWINDAAIDAKVGLYVETLVDGNAGQAWGAAFNYHNRVVPSAGMFLPGMELDYANDSGTPCRIGVADCTALRVAVGGSQITEGLQIVGNEAGAPNDSTTWALRINGDRVASQSAIEVDAASPVGLGFGISGLGGATHSVATIEDATTSPAVLSAGGAYSLAAIFINPSPTGRTARALRTSGIFSESVVEDDSTSPAVLDIGGRHAIAGIVERSESRNGISLAGRYAGSQIVGTKWSVSPSGILTAAGIVLSELPASPPSGAKGGGLCFDTKGVVFRC